MRAQYLDVSGPMRVEQSTYEDEGDGGWARRETEEDGPGSQTGRLDLPDSRVLHSRTVPRSCDASNLMP